MPPVVGAVITGIATGIGGIGFLGLKAGFLAGVVGFASSLVLGGLSQALSPKPKLPGFSGLKTTSRGRLVNIRESAGPKRLIYGEQRVGGTLVLVESTSANKYLHLVIALAGHEAEEIGDIWLDDELLPALDGGGNVTTGKFANLVRIKKHLGSSTQTADTDLVSEVAAWTTEHRLRGIAYIYVRLQFNRDKFQSVPVVTARVKGRKLFDPRDSQNRWSPNPALIVRDYLTDGTYGFGATAAEIDDTAINAAANLSEELVAVVNATDDFTADAATDELTRSTGLARWQLGDVVTLTTTGTLPAGLAIATDTFVIPTSETVFKLAASYANAIARTAIDITDAGSGTHTATRVKEPRYTANGTVESDRRPRDVLIDLVNSMAGRLAYSGGLWILKGGQFETPTVTLDESDMRAALDIVSLNPKRESFNAVKGVYVNPDNDYQTSDFPPVTNATFEADDGNVKIWKDVELPLTSSPSMAQRLAKIELERSRREITVEAKVKLAGLEVIAGDTVKITNARLGWTEKIFEVAGWGFAVDETEDGPALGVDLRLREIDSSVYAWSSSEEQTVQQAPETNLPDPFTVAAPTAVTLASGTAQLFLRLDGSVFSRIKISWAQPADEFVTSGGRIEIQHKKTADATWLPSMFVDGQVTEAFILEVQDGAAYDVRLRSVNHIGARSSFVTISNHTVAGKTAKPANVTGFTAAQNGDFVNFEWSQVADLDLAGYEIRFGPRGSTSWADATPLTKITRGTAITNGLVPPGDWTFYIKAFDTSGNQSATEGSADAVVDNTFDIILQNEQKPDWLGVKTSFIEHYTGVLVPDSQNLASADAFETFDQFVPNPVAIAIYEAPEQDAGFDDTVRVWADIQAALGPGETAGTADPDLQIDHRLDAGAYDGFENWTFGNVTARFVKQRLRLDTGQGIAKITGFLTTVDLIERTEGAKAVTIAAGGSAIVFAEKFHNVPRVSVMADSGSALIATKESVTLTGFTAHIFNTGGGNVGGTGDWQAIGV